MTPLELDETATLWIGYAATRLIDGVEVADLTTLRRARPDAEGMMTDREIRHTTRRDTPALYQRVVRVALIEVAEEEA